MAKRLGVGEQHNLPLPNVTKVLMPYREWKSQARGQEWRIGDTLNASIGQGYVLTSPLQLAVMTARLATNRRVIPRLIKSYSGLTMPTEKFYPL